MKSLKNNIFLYVEGMDEWIKPKTFIPHLVFLFLWTEIITWSYKDTYYNVYLSNATNWGK